MWSRWRIILEVESKTVEHNVGWNSQEDFLEEIKYELDLGEWVNS